MSVHRLRADSDMPEAIWSEKEAGRFLFNAIRRAARNRLLLLPLLLLALLLFIDMQPLTLKETFETPLPLSGADLSAITLPLPVFDRTTGHFLHNGLPIETAQIARYERNGHTRFVLDAESADAVGKPNWWRSSVCWSNEHDDVATGIDALFQTDGVQVLVINTPEDFFTIHRNSVTGSIRPLYAGPEAMYEGDRYTSLPQARLAFDADWDDRTSAGFGWRLILLSGLGLLLCAALSLRSLVWPNRSLTWRRLVRRKEFMKADEELLREIADVRPSWKSTYCVTSSWIIYIGWFEVSFLHIAPFRESRDHYVERHRPARLPMHLVTAILLFLLLAGLATGLVRFLFLHDLAEARHAYVRGDYATAADKAWHQIDRHGEDAKSLYLLGMSLAQLGDTQGAKEYLSRIDRNAPSNRDIDCRFTLARLMHAEGDTEGSVRLLEEDTRLNKTRKTLWLARNALLEGDPALARSLCDSLLTTYKPAAEAWLLSGELHEADHREDLAEEAYRKAIEADRSCMAAHERLVLLTWRQGRYDACLEASRACTPCVATTPDVIRCVADAQRRLGQTDAAEKTTHAPVRRYPPILWP